MDWCSSARRALPCLAVACALDAWAARPLVTDDAHILDRGSCQLETYYQHNPRTEDASATVSCNPFGWGELQVGGIRSTGEAREDLLVLQAKTLFRPAKPNGWGTGLVVGAQDNVRSGDSARFGNAYATGLLTVSFADDRVMLHANAGFNRNRYDRNNGTWGVASEVALGSAVTAVAETFGTTRGETFVQAGARWAPVPNRVELNAAAGRDARASGGSWWTVGLRLVAP